VRAGTFDELAAAIESGARHIVITKHLDLRPQARRREHIPTPVWTETIRVRRTRISACDSGMGSIQHTIAAAGVLPA
jgi:hypothetical protein